MAPVRGAWILLLLIAGCEPEPLLLVSLRSDYAPGLEVTHARVDVARSDDFAAPLASAREDVSLRDSLVTPTRLAELTVPSDVLFVRVTLERGEASIASRVVAVQTRDARAITVVMTRSCEGVRCPGAGDPAATSCVGGVCVSPECTPETPEACPPPECVADSECSAGSVPCAAPVCLAGSCGLRGDDARCEGRCDPRVGCVGAPDAGLDAGLDAGTPDAGSADCAAVCPGECVAGVCEIINERTARCPDGVPCRVRCSVNECRGGVFCGDAPCTVECVGLGGCRGVVECGASSDCDVQCDSFRGCPDIRCGTGRCTVACREDDDCNRVTCPPDGTCEIACEGVGSCAGIICEGDCAITCGDTACQAVDCRAACACDVGCTGSACATVMCRPGCESGSGCTSTGAGCDACP